MGWAAAGSPAYLAAARDPSGAYALFGLDGTGHDIFRIPLPDRGHAAAAHPTAPEAVAFARRPGRFALVIDCVKGRVAHRLDAPEGRHFYGHGAFLQGGAILATSENEIDTGKGASGCGPAQRAMPGSERSRQAGSVRMKSAAGPRMCWWWPMAAFARIPTVGGRS